MSSLDILKDEMTESNCYILEENQKAIVIDPNDGKRVAEQLRENGWWPEYIFLTHEHCDHIQGLNEVRKQFPKSRVIAQEICSKNIQSPVGNMSALMETYLHFKYAGRHFHYEPFICAKAELTFGQQYEMEWEGHRIVLESVPGHTWGSAVMWVDQTVVFSGDYLIKGKTDVIRLPGGDEVAYDRYARPWKQRLPEGTILYPGHGPGYIR